MPPAFANEFPAFSPNRAQTVLRQCTDLTIKLSYEMTVVSVLGSHAIDAAQFDGWRGKTLLELVAPDSRKKLELLVADNSANANGEGRWRHLNFMIDGQPNLPLLLKFFRFVNEGTAFQMICARDLRPMADVQKRFQQEQMNSRAWPASTRLQARRSMQACAEIFEMIKSAELAPIDHAVSTALSNIEKRCLTEALDQVGGDEVLAAQLLNISLENFRLRFGGHAPTDTAAPI